VARGRIFQLRDLETLYPCSPTVEGQGHLQGGPNILLLKHL